MTDPRKPPVTITRVATAGEEAARASQPPPATVRDLTKLYRSGEVEKALEQARALAMKYPASPGAWNIRGAAARSLGQLEEAEASFVKLGELQPLFAGAPYNLALVLDKKGRSEAAIKAYESAIALDAGLFQAHTNIGIIKTRMNDLRGAILSLKRALDLHPQSPETLNSLGTALKRAQRPGDARKAFEQALHFNPDFAQARFNLGVLLEEMGEPQDAAAALRAVLRVKPDNEIARAHLAHLLARCCDWDAIAEQRREIRRLGVETPGVPPWPLLAFEDAPERQLARAKSWAQRRFPSSPAPPQFARPEARPERLRIGYLGGDFHDHATTHLMMGMLAAHDRSRFEVHALNYGEQPEDAYRKKARAAVEHFHDIARQPNTAIAERVTQIGFDVLIDCKGYSSGTRHEILERRLAPVQLHYTAYPGTLAAPFIDYIVADRIVVPPEAREFMAERLIRLPHSYLPMDDRREIAPLRTSHADHGLPEGAFVFCCFNASYKITAREFDIWMRLLAEVEGSVLWLFRSNPLAGTSLRAQAKKRGIDPMRLVFAERLPNSDHLARHAHADLFLDTFAVNAHTTASDALWAGLPLVTRRGQQFAARVAASLLEAAGLSELITASDEEYERLALSLARDPQRLAAIRQKLAERRDTAPLFDTALYTRHFEAGLDAAYERWRRGDSPADIDVTRLPG
jgi:predicted O-linked N-acetylglucosamine transferase (SPINDLY family)